VSCHRPSRARPERAFEPGANLAAFVGAVLVAALAAGGCARSSSAERYVPSEEIARRSLLAMLDAWKDGEVPGRIETVTPAVQVADTHRRPVQKLVQYEILGELPEEGGRRFSVRLQFAEPAADEKLQYVVLGVDPVWVFHQADYDMVAHWDHPMPAQPSPNEAASPTP
jgi:hypothetical protein